MKLESLDDADDPRLADYREVKEPVWLRERGRFLAEGRVVIAALLASERFRARSLLVTQTGLDALAPELAAADAELPVYRVERSLMDRLAGVRFHQGCVAAAQLGEPLSLQRVAVASARHLLLLESVSDPDNVGTSFRNALAFGVDGVLLGPGCAPPLYRKALRTSMGAGLRVPFASADDWPAALSWLRESGFQLLALTPAPDAVELASVRLAPRVALLLGNEGHGLSEAAQALADVRVRISMSDRADSVNVSAAGAIAMHHVYDSLHAQPRTS